MVLHTGQIQAREYDRNKKLKMLWCGPIYRLKIEVVHWLLDNNGPVVSFVHIKFFTLEIATKKPSALVAVIVWDTMRDICTKLRWCTTYCTCQKDSYYLGRSDDFPVGLR